MDTPSKIEDNIGAVKNDDSLAPPLEKLPDTVYISNSMNLFLKSIFNTHRLIIIKQHQ